MRSAEGDWRQALDLLAAVEPEPGPPLAALLADESSAVGAGARARGRDGLAARARSSSGSSSARSASGSVSLVFVDPSSFAGAAPTPLPELLRLQAAGVAVVVLRDGDDLARAARRGRVAEAAHG